MPRLTAIRKWREASSFIIKREPEIIGDISRVIPNTSYFLMTLRNARLMAELIFIKPSSACIDDFGDILPTGGFHQTDGMTFKSLIAV